jgi:TetR/AcrR family transcriptional regulator
VTDSTATRQARRKQRTTDAILDAAERLFHERGYGATTIEAIAEAADVAIGSIYARFPGKEGLYLALVERAVEVNEAYVAEALARDATALERVLAVGDAYLRFHRDHPLAFRLVGLRDLERASGSHRARIRRRIDRRMRAMVDKLEGALSVSVAAGDTPPSDPQATALFLWGAWNGTIALHARGTIDDRALRAAQDVGRTLVTRALRG